MTKDDEMLDQLLTDLEDELGGPQPVETDRPHSTGSGDQDLYAAALGLEHELVAMKGGDVRTKRAAIEWGFDQLRQRVTIYAGLCLMFVRLCFNVGPLAPDAHAAWDITPRDKRRRCTADKARRGRPGYFRGGEHGHVVLCLGNGRCLTNDTGAVGTINVAMIADIESAWGYVFLGDTDWVNGEDVPAPKPRPRRELWEWRVELLTSLYARARQVGRHSRAAGLRRWIEAIKEAHGA